MNNFLLQMQALDWFVFAFILLLTIAAVIYGHQRKPQSDDDESSLLEILLMGRQLTLPLFVATLVATWYGGIFGVTQIAFEKGLYNFITQGFFWYITYIIFAFFMVDRIRAKNSMTMPQLLESMFGPKAAKLGGLFNFFNVIPVAYIISVGIIISSFANISMNLAMAIGTLVVVLYSIWGGLRAVVFSDLIQFFVMCLAVFLVVAFSISTYGGLDYLQANLPAYHFHPTSDVGLGQTLVWGFIALSTLVDPNFYQRCFAATNSGTAKKGILISTVVWIGFDLCTTFGAMYARAAMPEADSANAYMNYALGLLPTGLRGLFLAGIFATVLSTLDSYLFLASTTLHFDLLKNKRLSPKIAHIFSMLFVSLLGWSLAIAFDGNIKKVWKTLGSYSASCLLVPVLYGQLRPGKTSERRFICACLGGVITTTIWRFMPLSGFWSNVDELYIGMITTLTILILPKKIIT